MESRNGLGLCRLLAVVAALVFCIQVFSDNKADVDLWGNVGFVTAPPWDPEFHRANTFSFTEPDHAWINHEWLAEYVFHLVFARFGNPGLLVLKILLGLAVVLLIHLSMRREMRSGPLHFLYLLLVVSTMGYGFSTRPHLFTYLLLAGFLTLLKRCGHVGAHLPARSGFATGDPPAALRAAMRVDAGGREAPDEGPPRRCGPTVNGRGRENSRPKHRAWLLLTLLPALGLLWANLHGAFFLGALLIAIYAGTAAAVMPRNGDRSAGTNTWTVLGALPLFIAATLVNPYGAKLWSFVFESGATVRPYLSEWAMFEPVKHFYAHVDFLALAALSLPPLLQARTRLETPWIVVLLTAFVAAFLMRRNIPLFAIVAAFVVPRYLDSAAGATVTRLVARLHPGLVNAALAVFFAISAYACCTFNKHDPRQIEIPAGKFPVATVAFMQQQGVTGNVLVFFDWAEYCLWKLYPQCPTFLDGRFLSAYSAATIEDYFEFIYGGPDWRKALEVYPTEIVLIHRGNPVAGKMAELPDWQLAHDAGPALLYIKRGPAAVQTAAQPQPSISTPVYFP